MDVGGEGAAVGIVGAAEGTVGANVGGLGVGARVGTQQLQTRPLANPLEILISTGSEDGTALVRKRGSRAARTLHDR